METIVWLIIALIFVFVDAGVIAHSVNQVRQHFRNHPEQERERLRLVNRTWLAVLFIASLIFAGIAATCVGLHCHDLFHVFLELSVASGSLFLTVIVVEHILDNIRHLADLDRWEAVRIATMGQLTRTVRGMIYTSECLFDANPIIDNHPEQHPTQNEINLLQELANLAEGVVFTQNGLRNWYVANHLALEIYSSVVVQRFMFFAPGHDLMPLLINLEKPLHGLHQILLLPPNPSQDDLALFSETVNESLSAALAICQMLHQMPQPQAA